MTIRLACVSACLGFQVGGIAEAVGQETVSADPPRESRSALLDAVPFGPAMSAQPVYASPAVEPCGCAACVAARDYDEPVWGELVLLQCAERVQWMKLRWKRFCQRLRHQTYYPRCPPYWDACYGYRSTCWRRLPECTCCPPMGTVVPADPWSGGEFLPPIPSVAPEAPAVVPPSPLQPAPPPAGESGEASPSPGSGTP